MTKWQMWKDQFNFPMWILALWVIWAAQFAVLEFIGVKWPERYPTLTYLCRHAVPGWGLAMFIGWLLRHFLIESGK
jgi:hypothetical protein